MTTWEEFLKYLKTEERKAIETVLFYNELPNFPKRLENLDKNDVNGFLAILTEEFDNMEKLTRAHERLEFIKEIEDKVIPWQDINSQISKMN